MYEYDYVELRYPLFVLHGASGCLSWENGRSSSDNKNKYLIIL